MLTCWEDGSQSKRSKSESNCLSGVTSHTKKDVNLTDSWRGHCVQWMTTKKKGIPEKTTFKSKNRSRRQRWARNAPFLKSVKSAKAQKAVFKILCTSIDMFLLDSYFPRNARSTGLNVNELILALPQITSMAFYKLLKLNSGSFPVSKMPCPLGEGSTYDLS